jgi:two-component system response regulator HydG
MLTDITHFRKTIDRFKSDYAAEKKQSRQLQKVIDEIRQQEGWFAGSSKFVLEIKEKARAIADYAAPVLIEGPTGTGKEVVSRYIHQQSARRGHPLVKVDCSALPPNLIESELFGHEKGAFTGAIDRKIGKFEQADKGTLFLDEIGNLTREIQAKLLGVLQDHTITRIGGTQSKKLDIRIIAATNVSLENLTRSGLFREDLYYRINAITIFLPPLKDRLEDLPALCSQFLSQLNAGNEKKIKDLTPAAYKKLYHHPFPGNIRELRNIIHQAFIFCENEFIDDHDIQLVQTAAPSAGTGPSGKKKYVLKRMEKAEMESLLAKHKGVVQDVADEIGVTRQACYYFLERKGIRLDAFQCGSI